MSQSNALLDELKRRLKSIGLTYTDVAKKLKMSEANTMRLFSEKRFYFGVFDEVCQIAGLEISDLTKQVGRDSQCLERLSEKQERDLVSDTRLLPITFLILNGISFDEILQNFPFTKAQTIGLLTRLDRLKLIKLLPNNRFKLLISSNFVWRDHAVMK